MNIRLDNMIRINRSELPDGVMGILRKRLIFKNPLYYRNKRYGRPNYNIRPTIECIWEDKENGVVAIARGFLYPLIRILHANRLQFELTDSTRKLPQADFDFQGAPYSYQYEAWSELPESRFGILVGPMGSGKKVLALGLIASRGVPSLVVVTTKRAMYQWKDMARRFLGLGQDNIGLIGDGHRELGKKFTIGITLTSYKVLDELKAQTGFLIIDDCTKVNLKVFLRFSKFDCPYQLGLARARNRGDGLTGLMYAYLGERTAEIWPEDGWASWQGLGEKRPLLKIKMTDFAWDNADDWAGMVSALCRDEDRTRLVVADILQAIADPSARALVISGRISHLEELLGRIKRSYRDGEIITGEVGDSRREQIARKFERGKLQLILTTFKSLPTIEIKRVNRLFVLSPFKCEDHLIGIIGKLLQSANRGSQPVIYDYVDRPKVLQTSLRKRVKLYCSMGAVKVA